MKRYDCRSSRPGWNPPPPPRPPKPLCPPESCGCAPCREQGMSGPGVLLPRVLAVGREWLRRYAVELCVEGLPACARPPYTLTDVCAAGSCTWVRIPREDGRNMTLQATIPLICRVEDAAGCACTGSAGITVETHLRPQCQAGEMWRGEVALHPCVRLCSAASPIHTPCFGAQLEVILDSYLLRWEMTRPGMPEKPVCPPPLPLYPQPCR